MLNSWELTFMQFEIQQINQQERLNGKQVQDLGQDSKEIGIASSRAKHLGKLASQ